MRAIQAQAVAPKSGGWPEDEPERALDLVCGMTVDLRADQAGASRLTWRGRSYHFCSERCRRAFEQHPERFLPATVSAAKDVSEGSGARRLDLPVLPLNALTAAAAQERLSELSGVEQVHAEAGSDLLSVIYCGRSVAVGDLVTAAEAAGVHSGVATEGLRIGGAFCDFCGLAVERWLEAVPGVVSATFDATTDEVLVFHEPRRPRRGQLERAVRQAGYDVVEVPVPAEGSSARAEQERGRATRWQKRAPVAMERAPALRGRAAGRRR